MYLLAKTFFFGITTGTLQFVSCTSRVDELDIQRLTLARNKIT